MTNMTRAAVLLVLLFISATIVVARFPVGDSLQALLAYARSEPETALFVGDIMLARDVETQIEDIGRERFFEKVRPLHEASKYVVANFEASIPKTYVPTPSMTFQFSVREELALPLKKAGITHVSLANNHALDYGEEGYSNAFRVLDQASLMPFGHASGITASSSEIIILDGRTIGIVGLHSVWREPEGNRVKEEIQRLSSTTDIQIAYVHWGEEYGPVHGRAQESFARFLIESGVDVIIGHHPHVIQDIDIIDGAPVFYSLGNYVFDQYWTSEVRTGLAVRMSVERHAFVFELIPIDIARAQPQVMNGTDAYAVLDALANRSHESLKETLPEGKIRIPR